MNDMSAMLSESRRLCTIILTCGIHRPPKTGVHHVCNHRYHRPGRQRPRPQSAGRRPARARRRARCRQGCRLGRTRLRKRDGAIANFLQPLDRKVPMVACADIAAVAAELLQEQWRGVRVVELEAQQRVSPNDIAAAFAKLLGHAVNTTAVPRDTWHALFTAQGMRNPTPRMQMIDGFNEGWIDFEGDQHGSRKGVTTLEQALRGLLERA